jgi:hypothetical protein
MIRNALLAGIFAMLALIVAGMYRAQREHQYSHDTSLAIKTAPWTGDYTHDVPQPLALFNQKRCKPGEQHPMMRGVGGAFADLTQCKAIAGAK